MSVTLVQQTQQATGNSSSAQSLAYGSSNTSGNLLTVQVATFNTGVTVKVTDSVGNRYLQAGGYTTSGSLTLSTWYCITSTSSANTITVTPSTSAYLSFSISEYSGISTQFPYSLFASGSTGTSTTPSASVSGINTGLTLAAYAQGSVIEGSCTVASPFTIRANLLNGSADCGLGTADDLNITGSALTPTYTLGTSVAWIAQAASFNPVGYVPAGTYAPEIVTGPPLLGPMRTTYIEEAESVVQGPVTNGFIQTASQQFITGTGAVTLSFSRPVTTGSLLVAVIGNINTNLISSVTDSLGQKWQLAADLIGASRSLSYFFYENTLSGNNIVTITPAGNAELSVCLLEYAVSSVGLLYCNNNGETTTGASAPTGTIQTRDNKSLIIAACIPQTNTVTGISSGFNTRTNLIANYTFAVADNTLTGPANPTFTLSASSTFLTLGVSFSYSIAPIYAPEVVSGPPLLGSPVKSTYTEFDSVTEPTTTIQCLQQTGNASLATVSTTVNLNTAPGSTIFVVVETNTTSIIISDNINGKYTPIDVITSSSIWGLYYFLNGKGGQITVTISTASQLDAYWIGEYSGVTGIDKNSTATGSNASTLTTNVITSRPNEAILSFGFGTITPSSINVTDPLSIISVCERSQVSNSIQIGVAQYLNPPQGSQSITWSGGGYYASFSISLKSLNIIYPPEIVEGPPIKGTPIHSTYTELYNQIPYVAIINNKSVTDNFTLSDSVSENIVWVESVIDNLSLSDIASETNQLHGTYPPEIVTWPPIHGPIHTTYVEPIYRLGFNLSVPLQVGDAVHPTDVASESIQLHGIYPPEIVTGPPIHGPIHTTYVEVASNSQLHNVIVTDILTLVDHANFVSASHPFPETVTGPPIIGAPWKSTYIEQHPKSNATVHSIIDSLTLTDRVNYQHDVSFTDTITLVDSVYLNRTTSQNISDSLSITDKVQYSPVTLKITDVIVLSDSAATNGAHLTKSITDTITLTDSAGLYYTKNVTDSLTLTDHASKANVATDTLTLTDAATAILVKVGTVFSPVYAPEIKIGPPTRGPIKSTYIEQVTHNTVVQHQTIIDSLTISDGVIYYYYATSNPTPGGNPGVPIVTVPSPQATATNAGNSGGYSTTFTITNTGSNYITPPTVTLNGAGGSGATAYAVLTNGVVTSIVLLTPGSGYTTFTVTIESAPAEQCRQDKIYAPIGPAPYSMPTTVFRTSIILTYPYISPTVNLQLRNPELNSQDKKTVERIVRKTRNGKLLTFRDPQWPLFARLNWTIHLLHKTDVDDVLNFFSQSLGQQIGLYDFESRQWQGVIITPESAFSFIAPRGRMKSITFEFEGSLV